MRQPQDDGQATAIPDDGYGCASSIGGEDIDGVNPLYRCAFDRKKCFTYNPQAPPARAASDEPSQLPYCSDSKVDWPIFFSPSEQGSIDRDCHRGDALHRWVGSSRECLSAWRKFACAYTYDMCSKHGEIQRDSAAPNCHGRCTDMVAACGNETSKHPRLD